MGAPDADDAATQLADELYDRLAAFADLAPNVAVLADVATSEVVEALAGTLTEALTGPDYRAAATTARGVARALWPTEGQPPDEWWRTPFGRLLAGAIAQGMSLDEVVTIADAAKLLGVGHARVQQLIAAGQLESAEAPEELRTSRRGAVVTRRSVLERIHRNPGTGRHGWSDEALRRRSATTPAAE